MAVLRDILARFGVEVEGQEKLRSVDDNLRNTLTTAKQLGNGLRALGTAFVAYRVIERVKEFVFGQVEQADQLKHNAERLGLTTDELQKYQYVAAVTQTTTEQAALAFRYFNRTVGEAALGTKSAAKTFNLLGIHVKDAGGKVRPTDELLLEFSDKLKAIPDEATRTAIAMRTLGRGGSSMLPALQMGSAELREMFKDVDALGGVMDKDFVDATHETDRALKLQVLSLSAVRTAIVRELLPWITNSIRTGIRWAKTFVDMSRHTYGVRTALIALASTLAGYVAAVQGFKLFTFMISNPALAAGAAIVGAIAVAFGILYLAFDSLYTFLTDPKAKTIIGDWITANFGPETADLVRGDLLQAFKGVLEIVQKVADGFKNGGNDLFRMVVDSLPSIIKWGGVFTAFVLDLIDHGITSARNLFDILSHTHVFGGGSQAERDAVDKRVEERNAESLARKEKYDALARAFDFTTPISRAPVPGVDVPGTGTGTREAKPGAAPINVHVETTIHNSTDPKATGKAVGDAVKQGVKDAAAQNRDAYAAVNQGNPVAVW